MYPHTFRCVCTTTGPQGSRQLELQLFQSLSRDKRNVRRMLRRYWGKSTRILSLRRLS